MRRASCRSVPMTKSPPACFRDDFSFAFVVLRVQDLVRHALAREERREEFVLLDRDRTDKYRLFFLMEFLHFLCDRRELPLLTLKDEIVLVEARGRPIGRDRGHLQAVDLEELLG